MKPEIRNYFIIIISFYCYNRFIPRYPLGTRSQRMIQDLINIWSTTSSQRSALTSSRGETRIQILPGISRHRTVYATRSANCPCRLRRTTCRKERNVTKVHKTRANEADICPVSWRAAPRRSSSPFRQPTIRRLDSNRGRIFAMWNRVAEAVCLPEDPTSAPYCLILRSTVSSHPRICRCRTRHPCDLGIAWAKTDSVYPRQRCYHRCSSWSRLSNQARWPERNTLARSKWVLPWFSASDSPDPRYLNYLLHRRRSESYRLVTASPTCLIREGRC